MIRVLGLLAVAAAAAGCGLAGTSAANATTGAGAAEQARQAEGTISQVQVDLQAAQEAAAEARRNAEAMAE